MPKPRVHETDSGIQGEITVAVYNQMQRRLRDKGWIETGEIIKSGIDRGLALEVGSGPGYLGLEWLKQTEGTTLKGLDISPDMISVARANAGEYDLTDRVEYVHSGADKTPFEDETFDAVFSNGSLHEWSQPKEIFNEIWRVLKMGGRIFVSDFRRDMLFPVRWFLWLNARPKAIRPGLLTSIKAAYTGSELDDLIRATKFSNYQVSCNPLGLKLTGTK